MLRGAEKLTFAANNRLPRKVFPLPYLCYDTNIYHFILRFCKTKKNAHRMARSEGRRKKFTIFTV